MVSRGLVLLRWCHFVPVQKITETRVLLHNLELNEDVYAWKPQGTRCREVTAGMCNSTREQCGTHQPAAAVVLASTWFTRCQLINKVSSYSKISANGSLMHATYVAVELQLMKHIVQYRL